jgi:hypothetical protein
MTSEISITQGLAELKLLDKRIKKLIGVEKVSGYGEESPCFRFVDVRTKTHPVDGELLKQSASSNYQSFCDLLKRRDLIKRAIIQKNATTQIKIGKWNGSIAEAIEQKASIKYKKDLLEQMKKQALTATSLAETESKEVSQRLDKLLSSEMGKDVRTNPDTVNALTASFTENNKVTIVDPLGYSKILSEMEEEIDAFTTNVDWVLSEVNGLTKILI